ncbi:MAG: hypothetical protein E7222_08320 [Clostridiales bacterium]|nr:hypothetical protein [Clostridiales bacterium]
MKKIILLFLLLILLSACNNAQIDEKKASIFKQYEIALPAGMELPYDLSTMNDGTIYIAGFNKDWTTGTLWKMDNKEWKKIFNFTDSIPVNMEAHKEKEASVFILSENQLLYTLSLIQDNGVIKDFYYVIKDNKATKLSIQLPLLQGNYTNGILIAKRYNSNSFIIEDLTGQLFLIDNQTGKTIQNFTTKNWVNDFAIYNDNLYALTDNGIETLSIKTGVATDPCSSIKYLEKSLITPKSTKSTKFMKQRITIDKDETSKKICTFYIGDEGLKYSTENATKTLLKKKNTFLSDKSAFIYDFERYKNNYYAIALNEKGSHIFHYTNDEL